MEEEEEEDWDLIRNWGVGLVVGKWRRGVWRWRWGSLGRRVDEEWNISAIFSSLVWLMMPLLSYKLHRKFCRKSSLLLFTTRIIFW